MTENHNAHLLTGPGRWPRWAQRLVFATVGVALAVAALFFLAFALVAGGIIAAAIGIRVWWVMRKVRAQAQNTQALEGEYTVVERGGTERLER